MMSTPPPSYRGHDGQGVTPAHRRLLVLQIADIVFIQIEIDESAQASLIVVEMLAQIWMPRDQAPGLRQPWLPATLRQTACRHIDAEEWG